MVRRMVLAAMVLCLVSHTALADKAAAKETSAWGDAGYGTLAVVANLFYMPAKVVYATLGTVTGGLAYVLTVGDTDTANKVWSPSLGGTYVVTPAMLRGDDTVLFSGASYSND